MSTIPSMVFVLGLVAISLSSANMPIDVVDLNAGSTNASIASAESNSTSVGCPKRLTVALQAVDYCHQAQSMLSADHQRRSARTEKFIRQRVAAGIEQEHSKLQEEREALQAEREAMNFQTPPRDCSKAKLARLKVLSRAKICETKVGTLEEQMVKLRADHEVQLADLTKSLSKQREAQKAKSVKPTRRHKRKKKPKKKTVTQQYVEQRLHILEAELSASRKESQSAQVALKQCREQGRGDLSETRESSLNKDACSMLHRSIQGTCQSLNHGTKACQQLSKLHSSHC